MQTSSVFGIGLTINADFRLSDELLLRPKNLETNFRKLQDLADTQRTYGFLCSLADRVTIELSTTAKTPRDAAVAGWNAQWAFVLLSIVSRRPLSWPFGTTHPVGGEIKKINLLNVFLSPAIFSEPTAMPEAELEQCKELYPSFKALLANGRFSHAAVVASGNHREPFRSTRIAGIWSGIEALLGLDNELRFRISFIVAHLLGRDRSDKEERFKQTKKLYDLRSRCVHGAGLAEDTEQGALTGSLDLLCSLIILFAKRGKLLSQAEQNGFF